MVVHGPHHRPSKANAHESLLRSESQNGFKRFDLACFLHANRLALRPKTLQGASPSLAASLIGVTGSRLLSRGQAIIIIATIGGGGGSGKHDLNGNGAAQLALASLSYSGALF
jgi:hypothetical protein